MKSIRKFVYAAALTVSALSFAPTLASAQEAAGTFTLTHEVHWQNAVVPAGTYNFSIEASGPAEMLTLRKIGGDGAGFMLLVTEAGVAKASDTSEIVVVSRPNGSFVQSMQLPMFGMTLHFAVPAETREVAQAIATTNASASR
jgi:hypothetical protein